MGGSRKNAVVIILIGALMLLSGCFRMTADELYSLPQASQEYLKLQEQINAVLASGAEYSPPLTGPNRQSVQLKDIDGDGVSEAVAFFRTTGDKPLKIYIMKQEDGHYRQVNMIEGDGTAIESIRYADLDGDGVSELVIGWRMSPALLHMTVNSIKDNHNTVLAESDYSKMVLQDMDGDGNPDIIALRLPTPELPGQADMLSLRPDGEVVTSSARLSSGLETVTRIFREDLSDGAPGIIVEGDYSGGGVITDVFTYRDGLVNVTIEAEGWFSRETVRAYAIYSSDLNGDGVIEHPAPQVLPSTGDRTYYVIDWYSYDSHGGKSAVFTTYHDFFDGWYMILPDEWAGKITVRREDATAGERTIVFSCLTECGEETGADFLKIHTLSGDNKDDRARLPGRFKLLEYGDKIYVAEVLESTGAITAGRAGVLESFRRISPEWVTGVF